MIAGPGADIQSVRAHLTSGLLGRFQGQPSAASVVRFHRPVVAAATLAAIAAIGLLDFSTGIDFRIYPLYFLPVSLAAWQLGLWPAIWASAIAAFSWLVSNYLAGMQLRPEVWAFNAVMQGVSFIVVGTLIARLKGALDREQQLSRTDSLTSLLNARAFYDEAPRILAQALRHGHMVALAYIDLDNFKSVNDRMGHSAGDEVLRRAADVLKSCARRSDLCARLSGDEFVVLLSETTVEGAQVSFDRFRVLFAEASAAGLAPITVSVGAVAFAKPPVDIDEMVRHADAMMYAAKAWGKDRVTLEVIDQPVRRRAASA
jgi:diguanylate cyclase (GGDEF)-like protein